MQRQCVIAAGNMRLSLRTFLNCLLCVFIRKMQLHIVSTLLLEYIARHHISSIIECSYFLYDITKTSLNYLFEVTEQNVWETPPKKINNNIWNISCSFYIPGNDNDTLTYVSHVFHRLFVVSCIYTWPATVTKHWGTLIESPINIAASFHLHLILWSSF